MKGLCIPNKMSYEKAPCEKGLPYIATNMKETSCGKVRPKINKRRPKGQGGVRPKKTLSAKVCCFGNLLDAQGLFLFL